MGVFEDLREEFREIEIEAGHEGYWYNVSDVLMIMVCGMLCGLRSIDDIHDWAKSAPSRKFLQHEFGIAKILSRAQFYNILRLVDAEKFKLAFTRWMRRAPDGGVSGKTHCNRRKNSVQHRQIDRKRKRSAHSKCDCFRP